MVHDADFDVLRVATTQAPPCVTGLTPDEVDAEYTLTEADLRRCALPDAIAFHDDAADDAPDDTHDPRPNDHLPVLASLPDDDPPGKPCDRATWVSLLLHLARTHLRDEDARYAAFDAIHSIQDIATLQFYAILIVNKMEKHA